MVGLLAAEPTPKKPKRKAPAGVRSKKSSSDQNQTKKGSGEPAKRLFSSGMREGSCMLLSRKHGPLFQSTLVADNPRDIDDVPIEPDDEEGSFRKDFTLPEEYQYMPR